MARPHNLRRKRGSAPDVLPIWLALTLVTTLPYVLAWMRAPGGHHFTGVLTAYDDTFTYFAWIRQAADGRLLICDLYTSEPQTCQFFLPLWVCLGFVSRVTSLPIPLVFHLARLGSGLFLLLVARAVMARAFESRRRIRWTLWLHAFSGGLGWLVYLVKSGGHPLEAAGVSGSADLNLPEAFAFRSAFAQVHFTLGAALLCGALHLLFVGLTERKRKAAAWAGVMVTLLAVVHPYLVVVVGAVAGAMFVLWPPLSSRGESADSSYRSRYREASHIAFAFAAFCAPGIGYLFYLNRSNRVLQEWLRITDTLSPPPTEYALGFGLVGALALAGAIKMFRSGRRGSRLIVLWLVVQALLLYAPLNFQRRLVEGLQLPLVIAASVVMFWLAARIRRHKVLRFALIAALVLSASATNIGFVVGQIIARGPATGANDPRRYLSDNFVRAASWLRRNATAADVVLSSYTSGNVLPGMTGLRVYLGHYGQTMNSAEKGRSVMAFFTGAMPDEESQRFLADNNIGYVLFGPFEREVSSRFNPPRSLILQETIGDVEIYKVEHAVR